MKVKGIGFSATNHVLIEREKRASLKAKSLSDYLANTLSIDKKVEFEDNLSNIPSDNKKWEVNYISILDKDYPTSLKSFRQINSPTILSTIGNKKLLGNSKVGYSGSRKISRKGISIIQDSVSQLSQLNKNITIVSGYAKGADTVAVSEALKSGGTTIIVLAEGINSFHIHKELKDIWDWNRVLVISEYHPDDIWTVSRAMNRNKTIIGLSDVMIVVEAGERGGSFDAGIVSLNGHKPIFVPQYREYPESAKGNSWLIEMGAKPIRRKRSTMMANVDGIVRYIKQ